MHPADIKAHIQKAGSNQSAVARSVNGRSGKGVTPGAVYLVIRGLAKSHAIAKRISQITGVPVGELWPGKYPNLEAAAPLRARNNQRVSKGHP